MAAVFAESAVFFQMTQILAVGENLIRALIAFFSPPSVSPPFFMRADVHKYTLLIDLRELASSPPLFFLFWDDPHSVF